MKTAVVGAGYAGLSAAYDLARAGHEVVIYEASDQPGGLAVGLRSPIGTGPWKVITTTGSPQMNTCWA